MTMAEQQAFFVCAGLLWLQRWYALRELRKALTSKLDELDRRLAALEGKR